MFSSLSSCPRFGCSTLRQWQRHMPSLFLGIQSPFSRVGFRPHFPVNCRESFHLPLFNRGARYKIAHNGPLSFPKEFLQVAFDSLLTNCPPPPPHLARPLLPCCLLVRSVNNTHLSLMSFDESHVLIWPRCRCSSLTSFFRFDLYISFLIRIRGGPQSSSESL